MIKKLIKFIVSKIFKIYFIRSYSQEGEDMILRRLFEGENLGFYIDVGAHHPKRFSNTFMFYKKGWNGINIDAMPSSMKAFDKARPRDTNLEIPVSNKKELLTYYMFNEPALNGFSKNLTEERSGVNQYKVISEIKIETSTLKAILNEYLPNDQKIDFMSIDVEGLDLQVLKSNDWQKYSPTFVLVEVLNCSLSNIEESKEYSFLSSVGYEIYAKTMNTVFFRKI